MNLDLNGFNSSIANSASVVAEINRQNEEMIRSIAEATQERLAREEKMVAGAEANITQKELLLEQLQAIKEQNDLLSDNYNKLKELYEAQVVANQEAKEDLKRSKRFNVAMMIISAVAMLAAIAGPIVTILVSK